MIVVTCFCDPSGQPPEARSMVTSLPNAGDVIEQSGRCQVSVLVVVAVVGGRCGSNHRGNLMIVRVAASLTVVVVVAGRCCRCRGCCWLLSVVVGRCWLLGVVVDGAFGGGM